MAEVVHFRVCQCCGEVNEAVGQLVTKCHSCGKHLAPFYYFDESKAMGLQPDIKSSSEKRMISRLPHSQYPPVFGLTAYWEKE